MSRLVALITTALPFASALSVGMHDPFLPKPNATMVKFNLPVGKEQHLLSCAKMHLYGTTVPHSIADDDTPKFGNYRITIGEKEHLSVGMQTNAAVGIPLPKAINHAGPTEYYTEPSAEKPIPLTLLHVVFDGHQMSMTGDAAIGQNGANDSSTIHVWRKEKATNEIAQFTHGDTIIQVKSAISRKPTENGFELFNHLDLRLVDFKLAECTSGLLAEVWGISPMSLHTVRMLHTRGVRN